MCPITFHVHACILHVHRQVGAHTLFSVDMGQSASSWPKEGCKVAPFLRWRAFFRPLTSPGRGEIGEARGRRGGGGGGGGGGGRGRRGGGGGGEEGEEGLYKFCLTLVYYRWSTVVRSQGDKYTSSNYKPQHLLAGSHTMPRKPYPSPFLRLDL